MVAQSPMVVRADQIVSPVTLQVAREFGHDLGSDNQLPIARPPQILHDGMLHLGSSLEG